MRERKKRRKSERNTQKEKVVEWEELCCQLERAEKACFDTYHVENLHLCTHVSLIVRRITTDGD